VKNTEEKEHDMKKVLSLLVVGLLGASIAWAKPLNFEDANFDYSDEDLETAYIALAKDDTGALWLDFSSQESTSAVATIDVEDQVRGYDTDDTEVVFWEEDRLRATPDIANVFTDIDLDFRANAFQRVTLLHEGQNFATVRENYMAALEQLGFTLTPEAGAANTEIYTLQSAGETLRVLFVNQGADTQVTFTNSMT
jgi:hypothetical protein